LDEMIFLRGAPLAHFFCGCIWGDGFNEKGLAFVGELEFRLPITEAQ